MLTEEERLAFVTIKRRELEAELREAEILLGLIKGNLARSEVLFRQLETTAEEIFGRKQRKVAKVTPEMEQIMASMWTRKAPLSEIAQAFGVSDTTVRKRLVKMGILSIGKSREKVTPNRAQNWIERFRSGESIRRIARQAGVSAATVMNHIKKAGIPTSRPPRGSKK